MNIINDIGIVVISLYFLFLGAYYAVYAKVLYTATGLAGCWGTDCLMIAFLKFLCGVLGVVGLVYVILAIIIRFHRIGGYLALAACVFNILIMVTYLLRPVVFSLWITFIFPIRVLLTRSLEYAPVRGDLESLLETGFELFMILINIAIAVYLLRCFKKRLWGPLEESEEEHAGDEDEEMTAEEFVKAVRESFEKK